jgi:surface antigen
MTSRLTMAILLLAGLGIPATGQAEPTVSDNDAWMIQDSAQNSMEYAKTNQTTVWQNPDTGSAGDITPVFTYQNDQSEYCREYQQTVTIGGEQQQVYGTACRMPDGTWEVVSSKPLDDPQPAPTTVVYRDRVVYQPAPPPAYGYPALWPFAFSFAWFDNNWGLRIGSGGYPYGYYGGGYYYRGYRGGHYRHAHYYRGGHYRGDHYRGGNRHGGGHYRRGDRHRGGNDRGAHRGGRGRGGNRGGGTRHANHRR